METVGNLENFVKTIGKPYQDAAQKDWTNFQIFKNYQMLIKNLKHYALRYKMFMYHDKMILSLNFITGQFSLRFVFLKQVQSYDSMNKNTVQQIYANDDFSLLIIN